MHRQLIAEKKAVGECADKEEMADAAFAFREIEEMLRDSRYSAEKLLNECQARACLLWTKTMLQDPEPIRTEYVVATPDVKTGINLPPKGSDQHKALLRHFGIKEEFSDVAHLHWPGLIKYLSHLAEEGKPLPAGLKADSTYNIYKLTIRQKKGVDE